MSREAIRYKITLEREDGEQFRYDISDMEGRHEAASIYFRADKYLSKEYIENFKKSMFHMISAELDTYYKKQYEEKLEVCVVCHQDLTEIKQ